MGKYWNYFKYICEHKKNVFKTCIDVSKKLKGGGKLELLIHAFTHDLSKFRPSEFFPYANLDFQNKENNTVKTVSDFQKAWELHYKRNKHHPEHWKGEHMPIKYVRQMVCDLKAMSLKFGGTAQEYYLRNYFKWNITMKTRFALEVELDLITSYNAPICECNDEYWMTIGELIMNSERNLKLYGTMRLGSVEANINDLLKPACDKYNINIYNLVTGSRKG